MLVDRRSGAAVTHGGRVKAILVRFVVAVLLAAGAVGLLAQPANVGFLGSPGAEPVRDAFLAGMRELGYQEERDFRLVARMAERDPASVAQAVEELVRVPVRLIVSQGPVAPTVHAALRGRLPMVFGFSGDPVEAGMVKSLARPGGRSTGVSMLSLEVVGKRLELLKELRPDARRVAVLVRPGHAGAEQETRATLDAAAKLGLRTLVVTMETAADLPASLERIRAEKVDGMVVFPDAVMLGLTRSFAEFSRTERMLVVMGWREFVRAGLPASFGPSTIEVYRTLARHAGRILAGAQPQDLPTELPGQFYLTLNRRALAAAGIDIPRALELRADEIVE